jgi:tRNA threonylcarbamoyladenosine modification (KEOPS) complex Cgi121 subunit
MQLLAAVNRAVHDQHHGLMRTKHLHSEIVYALAGTQNVTLYQVLTDLQITEAFKTFGLSDATKSVIVVKVAPNADAVIS